MGLFSFMAKTGAAVAFIGTLPVSLPAAAVTALAVTAAAVDESNGKD